MHDSLFIAVLQYNKKKSLLATFFFFTISDQVYSATDLCMKMSCNVLVSFPLLICHMAATPLHSLACLFPSC